MISSEAEVFEYLTQQAKEHSIASVGLRVNDGLSGNYATVWDAGGNCGVGDTIALAVNRLPDRNQSALDLKERAKRLENEASVLHERAFQLMEKAAQILGEQPKSFGPDD